METGLSVDMIDADLLCFCEIFDDGTQSTANLLCY